MLRAPRRETRLPNSTEDGAEKVGVFEAIDTQRAIRRFKPDPIPETVVARILEAGTKAPSGGNGQPWQFIVIKDPDLKAKVAAIYEAAAGRRSPASGAPPPKLGPPTPMAEAPLLIMVCRRTLDPPIATSTPSLYASIYPAVQNMLLAARALGVGSVLTTVHIRRADEMNALLDIPDDVETCALLPMGYPKGHFGPTQRMPWQEVTYIDRWGTNP